MDKKRGTWCVLCPSPPCVHCVRCCSCCVDDACEPPLSVMLADGQLLHRWNTSATIGARSWNESNSNFSLDDEARREPWKRIALLTRAIKISISKHFMCWLISQLTASSSLLKNHSVDNSIVRKLLRKPINYVRDITKNKFLVISKSPTENYSYVRLWKQLFVNSKWTNLIAFSIEMNKFNYLYI